jgi:hypothetical protein
VRTLILETKSSSKIRTQIDEINAMEREGELDKKQKTKKKMLQDTLAKVIELEKLKYRFLLPSLVIVLSSHFFLSLTF